MKLSSCCWAEVFDEDKEPECSSCGKKCQIIEHDVPLAKDEDS